MFIGFLPKVVLRSALMSPLCVPNVSPIGVRICVLWQILRSVQNEDEETTKKLKRNFVCSYLRHGWTVFLQIWYVDSHNWPARLLKIWFQSDKRSRSYIGVKITFSFFLLIYSRCGAPDSWATRHAIVCLDHLFIVTGQTVIADAPRGRSTPQRNHTYT